VALKLSHHQPERLTEVLSKHPFILCSPFSLWHGVVQLLPNSESKKAFLELYFGIFQSDLWPVVSLIMITWSFFFFTVLLRMILVASCRVWMYYLFDLLNEEWKPYWFLRGKTSKTIVNSSIPPFLLSFGEELKKKRKIGFQFLIFFAKDWIPVSNFLCYWKCKPLMFNDQSRKYSSTITRKVHITLQNPTNSSVEPIVVTNTNLCNASILVLEDEACVSSWCNRG
jgi:hypothetical protein